MGKSNAVLTLLIVAAVCDILLCGPAGSRAVEGPPCQFLMNRISADHWKVVLINNAGVIKHPFAETEYHVEQYTAAMSIIAPAGATAKESLANARGVASSRHGKIEQAVFALDVPPGTVRVVDIRLPATSSAGGERKPQ